LATLAGTVVGGKVQVEGDVTATVDESTLATSAEQKIISGTGYTILLQAVNAVGGTAQTLIAATGGKAIYVVEGHLTCAGATGECTILDATTPIDYRTFSAIGSDLSISPRAMTRPVWQTTASAALKVTTQTSQTLSGYLKYILV
jgi:hypothetical protein